MKNFRFSIFDFRLSRPASRAVPVLSVQSKIKNQKSKIPPPCNLQAAAVGDGAAQHEHVATLTSAKFEQYRRRDGSRSEPAIGTSTGGPQILPSTIALIEGHKDGTPDSEWTPTALRFSTLHWTAQQARDWLKANHVEFTSFADAADPELYLTRLTRPGGTYEPTSEQRANGSAPAPSLQSKIENQKSKMLAASWFAPVTIEAAAAGEGISTRLPRISIDAYNGGPMSVAGAEFPYPVVIDHAGLSVAAARIPIYAGHPVPGTDNLESLLGQTDQLTVSDAGVIFAGCDVTGVSASCGQVVGHSKNGFQWQASVGANVPEDGKEFIPPGASVFVNGRTFKGPLIVARKSTLAHIAIVALGADTSTSARIAASHLGDGKETNMNPCAEWAKAEFGLDFDGLSKDQQGKIQAKYSAHVKASADADAKKAAAEAEGKKAAADQAAAAAAVPVNLAAQNAAGDLAAQATAAIRLATTTEMKRISGITGLAAQYPGEKTAQIQAEAVEKGWDLAATELAMLRASRSAVAVQGSPAILASGSLPKDGLLRAERAASRGGRHDARGGRLSDDMCAVIETAGLISAGYSAERLSKDPCYGERCVIAAERAMRTFGQGLGPVGLIRMAAEYCGHELPRNHRGQDFFDNLRASFSTMHLPVILSNLMNKFILDSYMAVDPDQADPNHGIAWQKFVRRAPVNDFKPNYFVRLMGDMRFQDLGATGEIQHGEVGEQSYKVQAKTKAILLGISREAIVNDDLSVMSSVPSQFGRGAGLTIAKAVYDALQANSYAAYQSDGSTAFFSVSDITTAKAKMKANALTAAGNALSSAGMDAAVAQMDAQTDPFGLPAGVYPELLLVPPGLKQTAIQLYTSQMLIPAILYTSGTAKGQPANNPYVGLYKPVCSAYLAVATTWYLLTGPQQAAAAIVAGFLNGQEMPIVERAEAEFDRLGIAFRGFQDFGVSMMEPRAAIKNAIS